MPCFRRLANDASRCRTGSRPTRSSLARANSCRARSVDSRCHSTRNHTIFTIRSSWRRCRSSTPKRSWISRGQLYSDDLEFSQLPRNSETTNSRSRRRNSCPTPHARAPFRSRRRHPRGRRRLSSPSALATTASATTASATA